MKRKFSSIKIARGKKQPGTTQTEQAADEVARDVFGVKDEITKQHVIRDCLSSIPIVLVLIPAIFWLRFGEVGPLGWATTIFFEAYLVLTAVGLFFKDRTEYHSPVQLHGGFFDRLGSVWMVACVFGPLLGWFFTTGTIPITLTTWRFLFGSRVFFAAIVPLVTALPLTRYLKGKSIFIGLPILLIITLLAVSSAMNVSLDLWQGPQVRPIGNGGVPVVLLAHTGRVLG